MQFISTKLFFHIFNAKTSEQLKAFEQRNAFQTFVCCHPEASDCRASLENPQLVSGAHLKALIACSSMQYMSNFQLLWLSYVAKFFLRYRLQSGKLSSPLSSLLGSHAISFQSGINAISYQLQIIIIAWYYSETTVSSYVTKISYNDATSGFNYMVGTTKQMLKKKFCQ